MKISDKIANEILILMVQNSLFFLNILC